MKELYRYRDLIWMLVVRDLKVRYRRSVIGFAWSMLQPLLTMGVLLIVFSTVFRFQLQSYPVYALSGLLFWNFFHQSIIASMNSLRTHANILQKLPVPMAVFPVASVLSGVVNLLLALIPLSAILVFTKHGAGPAILFLPVSIVLAALFTLGAGLLLAPLAVFFVDVVELVTVVLTLIFYLTPVFYPMIILEGHRFAWLVRFNPARSILEVFRDPIYFYKVPPLGHLAVAALVALIALVIGSWTFKKSADRIPFYL
jgi:ABC-type polysaccharide/polyol phosphate export permease